MISQIEKRESPNAALSERTRNGMTYSPRIDIWESADELVLYADLPGVCAEDLDVQFENHELTIHGKVAPRQPEAQLLYGEYGVGDYYRSFNIGESIDAGKIHAELQNGVLALHLPKTEEVKPRRIEVKTS
jgi:HSP20 family molecular chaperone IbpA